MIVRLFLLNIVVIIGFSIMAQKPAFFIEPEFYAGFVVPNYPSAPKAGRTFAADLALGFQAKKDSSWQAYYGMPQTGLQLSYLHMENQKELGSQYSVNPFIVFNQPIGTRHSIDFKIGIGMAYQSRPYDSISNPSNLAIGSPITWFFNSGAYYRFVVNPKLHLKVGGGFWHASNGHTTLPNFGQNYGMFGAGLQYYPLEENPVTKYKRSPVSREKHYYLKAMLGSGYQEYGATSNPIGGPKYAVIDASAAFMVKFRKYLGVHMGLSYRYYEAYAQSVVRNEFPDVEISKNKAASNVILFLGTELFFGHVSFDIRGGMNLYKPYFPKFYDAYEHRSQSDKTLKILFNTRLGINAYLFNTAKLPKHNVALGAYINANYGQADFTSFLLTYHYKLK